MICLNGKLRLDWSDSRSGYFWESLKCFFHVGHFCCKDGEEKVSKVDTIISNTLKPQEMVKMLCKDPSPPVRISLPLGTCWQTHSFRFICWHFWRIKFYSSKMLSHLSYRIHNQIAPLLIFTNCSCCWLLGYWHRYKNVSGRIFHLLLSVRHP